QQVSCHARLSELGRDAESGVSTVPRFVAWLGVYLDPVEYNLKDESSSEWATSPVWTALGPDCAYRLHAPDHDFYL
ncbi:hypothetical protein, partial [Paraburkholderia dipogonis]|uniref:hypothetical protein n=1 Tax=Paraburkholderia dipogonis TaxID=1211383 RepID=UPI00361687ED